MLTLVKAVFVFATLFTSLRLVFKESRNQMNNIIFLFFRDIPGDVFVIPFAFLILIHRKNETMFYLQLKTHFIRDKMLA